MTVATTMLRRLEPPEERTEPTTLRATAIKFPHWADFTLLRRIQRYMWRITTPHE